MQGQKVVTDVGARKRKGLLWMPVVVVPVMAILFHLLGGGKGVAAGAAVRGVNMTLPQAVFAAKGQPTDKLGYYAKAALDSARLKERLKRDPYAAGRVKDSAGRGRGVVKPVVSGVMPLGLTAANRQADQLVRRIGEMKAAMGRQGVEYGEEGRRIGPAAWERGKLGMQQGELGRGVGPLVAASTPRVVASPPDPEMARIDGLLDKIIRVQHPEQVMRDSAVKGEAPAKVMTAGQASESNGGFMEIGDADALDTTREAAIRAVVNGDQVLVLGSGGAMTVELRLLEDVEVNGQSIPANSLIYGRASVSAGRLAVNVSAIRVGQVIVTVSLQAYDLDGQPGIRINGSIAGDVSKEWADETLSGLGIASVDPSLGAQAATAGMQLAKSLAGRKVRQIPVSLPAGYEVLLKNVKH